ncbi:hypothetical protein Nepgr_013429 [Nepenthes gracilis]|uniref:Uncharacterized protein n=1 Tax=Nepenthes gracilis TaxID=150966 RepID=A0AAD3SHT3_NEPGR|nr:hypothetical protein Nepgr_013429 [Nepenthes gracilis]
MKHCRLLPCSRCSRQCFLVELPTRVESWLQFDSAAAAAGWCRSAPNAGVLSGWMSIAVLMGNGPVMLLRC